MKCTFHWLKDFVDFDFTPEELGEQLTMLGMEVESIESVSRKLAGVIVGEIVEELADNQCKIKNGQETHLITLGLSSLPKFKKVALQTNPSGDSYKLATYKSLGIFESDSPVYVGEDCKAGEAIDKMIPATDSIYDLAITPNRPDCLSIFGIAREIATLTGNPLKVPSIKFHEIETPTSDFVKVKIENPEGCPRYSARVIRNVSMGASPLWVYDRLAKVGLRSLNNIVDITNYVLIEYGFPLHAFDYDLIENSEIVVRSSKEGESFRTLDDKTHELKSDTVLICDGNKPVALGGIMGGINSEVNEKTKDVLLECAYFDPQFIRNGSTELGIVTEASIRFRGGVDPNGILVGSDRATELISEIAHAEVLKGIVDEYIAKIEENNIELRLKRIERVLGVHVQGKEVERILTRLGCKVIEGNNEPLSFNVKIPTYRPDLCREIDLIEEIARFVGFDKIPETDSSFIPLTGKTNNKNHIINQIKEIMRGYGFYETVTNSMIPSSDLTLKYYPGETANLINPLSEDMAILRPSLVPCMIQVAQFNLFRQQENICIYEIGSVFYPNGTGYHENLHLTGLLIGKEELDHWKHRNRKFDFYDLKGLVEDLCDSLKFSNVQFDSNVKNWAVVDPYLNLNFENKKVGFLGKLNPKILDEHDISEESFIFELTLDNIIPSLKLDKIFHAIPKYPWVKRDLAFIMDYDIPGGNLIKKIREWGGEYLKRLSIFDVYDGEQVPVGKKSLAFAMTFQADEKTLIEDDVNQIVDGIILKVKGEFNAELRS